METFFVLLEIWWEHSISHGEGLIQDILELLFGCLGVSDFEPKDDVVLVFREFGEAQVLDEVVPLESDSGKGFKAGIGCIGADLEIPINQ